MIEPRVCYTPHERPLHIPPLPTAKSWRWLREQCGVKGVRLQYLYDDPRWWPGAAKAAIDGGMQIHGNFCANDWMAIAPEDVEAAALRWAKIYADPHDPVMTTVSALNEVGYSFGPDDIAKGGTRDYMKELVDNFWMPFIRGVRRANPDIIIGGPDAESADTLQRFVDLVDVDQWNVHPYGEKELADDGDLDYATMDGENGKPGFRDTIAKRSRLRPLIISEADLQQLKSAKARERDTIATCLAQGMTQTAAEAEGRSARGIATDAEIDRMTAFSIRMRDEFHAPVITFGTAEYFCTRIKCGLWRGKFPGPPVVAEARQALGIPDLTAERLIEEYGDTWSTWTFPEGGEPVMSEAGKRLSAVFRPPAPKINHRTLGRRAS